MSQLTSHLPADAPEMACPETVSQEANESVHLCATTDPSPSQPKRTPVQKHESNDKKAPIPKKEATPQQKPSEPSVQAEPKDATEASSETAPASETDAPAKPKAIRRLSENVKKFIVIHNAYGMAPRHVAKAVKEAFDLSVTPSQIERYDPTKVSGLKLRDEYKVLFLQTKHQCAAMVINEGVGSLGWRLARLHQMTVDAYEKGNFLLAAALMKQAAMDKGGLFTKTYTMAPSEPSVSVKLAKLLNCSPDAFPTARDCINAMKTLLREKYSDGPLPGEDLLSGEEEIPGEDLLPAGSMGTGKGYHGVSGSDRPRVSHVPSGAKAHSDSHAPGRAH